MKKVLRNIAISICIFCGGCTLSTSSSINDLSLETRLQSVEEASTHSANHNKGYYSYYIQPSIGRFDSDQTSNILNVNGTKVLMNLNVSSIINKKYYSDADSETRTFQRAEIIATYSGTYTDSSNSKHSYVVNIYDFDEYACIVFVSDTLKFYSLSNINESIDIAVTMLEIARSTIVDETLVVNDFSNKETTEISQNKIELFESIAPENGRIEELFEDYQDTFYTDNNQNTEESE